MSTERDWRVERHRDDRVRWRLHPWPGRVHVDSRQAAWSRSAGILNVHPSDTIISVVTVTATRSNQCKVAC